MATKDFLLKIAEVLDATADYIDSTEKEKLAAVVTEKQSIINALAAKYAETTGDSLPDEVKTKLASSDNDIVKLVTSLVEKHAGTVDSLGTPSEQNDEVLPKTKKEATEQAEDKFVSWILS